MMMMTSGAAGSDTDLVGGLCLSPDSTFKHDVLMRRLLVKMIKSGGMKSS